jgi:hypothetical protein
MIARVLAALGLAAAVTLPATAADGDLLVITGVVTDAAGRPLPDVQVSLEASRSGISIRTLRRAARQTQRVSTTTGARGEYSIDWRRSSYFNEYALVAEIPVREAGRDARRELARVDLSSRVRRAQSPLVVALGVEDTSFLDALTGFLASLDSADERRVYELLGRPDAVDTVRYGDRVEDSWWYFAAGKVVRLRDGVLVDETAFEPVRPFNAQR